MADLHSVFSELRRRHKELGADIVGGFSPAVAPLGGTSSNLIVRSGECLSTSGSIADSEMFLLHGVCEILEPKKILVIGNSYGLSTAFFALSNPQAEVVAFDKFRIQGLEFTRKLCAGLRVTAIEASTPEDIEGVISTHFDGQVDMVLVDAVHENDVQSAEFRVLAPLLSDTGTVIFHDVLFSNLIESMTQLTEEYPAFDFRILAKTFSGLGVATRSRSTDLSSYLEYFESSPEIVARSEHMFLREIAPSGIDYFGRNDLGPAYRSLPHPQT